MHRGWSRAWVAAWLWSALPIAASAARLEGIVTDASNKPIAGAVVSVLGTSEEVVNTKTIEDGSFTLEIGDDKTVLMRVDHPQYATRTMGRLGPGQKLGIQLTTGFSLEGQVIDRRSGKPLAAAEVRVHLQGDGAFLDPLLPNSFARLVKTGPDGRFSVEHLAAGTHRVEVLAAAHARDERAPLIAPPPAAPPAPLLFYLDPGVELAGLVRGPDGKPVLGARVSAQAADDGAALTEQQAKRREKQFPSSVSDKDGKFALRGVPLAESYSVSAQRRGFPTKTLKGLKVTPGQKLGDIALTIDAGGSLTATLQTPDGTPYSSILALAYRATGDPWASWSYKTNNDLVLSDGVFHVDGFEAGRFEVVLVPDQMANLTLPAVDVTAGRETNLGTLKFSRGSVLQGRVVDAEDHGVSGVAITAKTATLTRYTITDGNGNFSIAGFGPNQPATLLAQHSAWVVPAPTATTTGAEPVTIALLPAASVVGRVVTGTPPKPLSIFGVRLSTAGGGGAVSPLMFRDDQAAVLRSFINENGQFGIGQLAPGDYNLRIEAEGFLPRLFENIALSAGQKLELGDALLDRGARLAGRVIDKATKQPVAGAAVSLLTDGGRGGESMSTVTTTDGRFVLQGLAPGSPLLRVESDRWASSELGISIAANTAPEDLTIELLEGGAVEGVVLDDQGKPLPDVSVRVWPKTQSPWTSVQVKTDAGGHYRVPQLTPGPADVSATIWPALPEPTSPEAQNIADINPEQQEITVSIESGKTVAVNFPLRGGVTLHGTVRYGKKPLKVGLMIMTMEQGASANVSASSDDSGAYSARVPAPGEYLVMLMSMQDDIPSTNFNVRVPADVSEFSYDLVVPDAVVQGRVVDGDSGLPLAAVHVELESVDQDGTYVASSAVEADAAQTNQNGEFEIKGVEAGRYQLMAVKPGYAAVYSAPFKVRESATKDQFVSLYKAHLLTLNIVDMQGMPIPGAMVYPLSLERMSFYVEEETNDNGVVTLSTLPDGEVDVLVSAGGYGVTLFSKLSVGPGNPEAFRGELKPENVLVVTVQDSNKAPLSDVSLHAISIQDGPSIMSGVVNALGPRRSALKSGPDGRITVGALAAGLYVMEFSKGQQRQQLKVKIEDGKPHRATLTMP